jgi:hypothetical protein
LATNTKKESLTIDQYLKGCNCQTIYFNAGGCTLVLTNLEGEHSKLIQSDSGYEMLLGNDLTINRFYKEKNDKLIEIQIKAEYGHLFYMMYPTGTFVHKETF